MNILQEDTLSILQPDLVDKARIMSKAYEYLYCLENILRDFLDKHPNKDSFKIPLGVTKSITDRRNDELKNKWLPLRGNNDFYYIDFKDLGSIIGNNWELFKDHFPSQYWIIAKIEDLTRCRNLIAHNSYIDLHELNLIKANFNTIVRQLHRTPIADYKEATEQENKMFVKGLKHSALFTLKQAEEGLEYPINYPAEMEVAPSKLIAFFNQVGLDFRVCYENVQVALNPDFKIGFENEYNFKDHVMFQFGLHDIDDDGIDELFICLGDNDTGAENGVQVCVFKYYPPALKAHAYRSENWEQIESFEVQMILGDPTAYVEKNSITVPRNLRGFYYERTFVKGQFITTGNF
jgi:hypothetical protein